MRRVFGCFALACSALVVSCGGGSNNTARYRVGGTIAGLSRSGLVLQNNSADDLSVAAGSTSFTFPATFTRGATYAVTVKTQPVAQVCEVANGAGILADADVSVGVNCSMATFTVGGGITGLTAGGLKLRNTVSGETLDVPQGATSYAFAGQTASGASYAVIVAQQPAGLDCAVANGSGTVGSAAVTDADVSCLPGFSVGGTVSGLESGKQVVLQDNGGDDLTVHANGTFTFSSLVGTGRTYRVTVRTHPVDEACTVSAGSGTMGGANITAVTVSCTNILVQRWQPPTSWGGMWPASSSRVQHAYFDGASIIEDGSGIGWTTQGAPQPQRKLTGLPSGDRWGAGPFGGAARWRYQATNDGPIAGLTSNMLVCAVVKPHYDFPQDTGQERAIIAKGYTNANSLSDQPGGGWVLMQMHEQFCFHYHYVDASGGGCDPANGNHCWSMVYTPTFFANGAQASPLATPHPGPLNPSYVVYCAGRDGDTIRVAVNSLDTLGERTLHSANAVLDLDPSPVRTTIGGYAVTPDPSCAGSPYPCQDNDYLGLVYETAIWNEPATVANIQAKLAAFQGLVQLDGRFARYHRNREGPFVGTDGLFHVTWRHGPRMDPTRGMLFGGQAWNRLSHTVPAGGEFHPFDIFVPGEDLGVASWTAEGTVTVEAGDVVPPGDSEQRSARRVTLGSGGSLSTALGGPFDAPGPIQGQVWVMPVSPSGTLRVQKDAAQGGGTTHFDVDLAAYPTGQWTRVWLTGLTTDGSAGRLWLLNAGSSAIQFYVWGLSLTQLGGGGDVGAFDPGPYFYDWSSREGLAYAPPNAFSPATENYEQDALELPSATVGTGSSGFCVSVDAQPLTAGDSGQGLAWDAPMHRARTLATWVSDGGAQASSLYVNGTDDAPSRQLCFRVSGAGAACAAVPPSWMPGSKHNLKGCVSASGQARLFGDDLLLGSPVSGPPALDLSTGHLVIGNAVATATTSARPWHGWIANVVTCRDPGDAQVAACR